MSIQQKSYPTREVLRWLLGKRKRFVVRGRSMTPMLCDGDHVFVEPLGKTDELLVGDVVVARHPFQKMFIVKRIEQIHKKHIVLRGLHEESADSRTWGWVSPERIVGKVRSVS